MDNNNLYKGLTINGFTWLTYIDGYHYFYRKDNELEYKQIRCKPEHIINGFITHITKYDLTM